MKPLTYLVPVDFTACSSNALQYAAMLAKFSEAKVKLCHVIDLDELPESENPVVVTWSLDRMERKASNKIKSLSEMVSLEQVTVDYDIVMGNVKIELLKQVNRVNPHVIVIGRDSDEQPGRNSIASYLTRYSKVPVLIVPGSLNPKVPVRLTPMPDKDMGSSLESFLGVLQRTSPQLAIHCNSDEREAVKLIEKLRGEFGIEATLVPHEKNAGLSGIKDFIKANKVDLLCSIERSRGLLDRLLKKEDGSSFVYPVEVPVLVLKERTLGKSGLR